MSDSSNISLKPRRKPVQARSRERVETILSHAAGIFHEMGVDGTSMSAIARNSDMSLASLYRYFPNKASIVKALAEQHVAKMETVLQEKLAQVSIDEAVDVLIDEFYHFYRTEPAYSAIWSGVEAMPELRDLDLQELYANARDLEAKLAEIAPDVPAERRHTASLLLPRAAGSILRLAVTMPEADARPMLDELKTMARAYLAGLIGESLS
jgi:AcrR family transcriptional regulator